MTMGMVIMMIINERRVVVIYIITMMIRFLCYTYVRQLLLQCEPYVTVMIIKERKVIVMYISQTIISIGNVTMTNTHLITLLPQLATR